MQIVQQVVRLVRFNNDRGQTVALDVMKINTMRSLTEYDPERTEISMDNGVHVYINLPFNTVLQLVIDAINH